MCRLHGILAFTLLALAIHATAEYVEEYPEHFTNDFVVQIDGDGFVADLVASSHGFRNIEKIENLGDNLFLFIHDETEHRSKRSADTVLEQLNRDPSVLFVEQQQLLVRQKRGPVDHERHMVYDKQTELQRDDVDQELIIERYFGSTAKRNENPCRGTDYERGLMDFNDQYYCLQWYLTNNGQTKGKRGYDINVKDAWDMGFSGRGVRVTVLDDGLDHEHPEIRDNYDAQASYDLNDLDDPLHDPQPPTDSKVTAHGTRCAGEIAGVADNGVCGVGVAFHASIGGVRLLDGGVTDRLEAQGLSFKRDYVHVYSSSWGPRDNGKTMEAPSKLTREALKLGAERGRGGKGNIFAWATGNGGAKDDCNADGYVSSIYTLSIGCINDLGLSTYFSEICPSTLAVIFTGGSHKPPGQEGYDKPDISIITADVGSTNGGPNCDLDFEGTSSAAPLLAGCVALVLEANMDLTWRDMQHLVVETARVPNPEEDGWLYNGAGYHVNHKFGFGSIDCSGMVSMALMWVQVTEQLVCDVPADNPEFAIGTGERESQKLEVTRRTCDVERLEHARVHVTFTTTYRGDMSFHLVSPSGTDSEILSTRPNDDFNGEFEWTFMSVHYWNERCTGDWMLYIQDQGPPTRHNQFTVKEWSLELYGTHGPNPNEDLVRANKTTRTTERIEDQACELPISQLNDVMAHETQEYTNLNKAVERGEPYSREAIEKLAEEMIETKGLDALEQFIEEELKKTESANSQDTYLQNDNKYTNDEKSNFNSPNYERSNGYTDTSKKKLAINSGYRDNTLDNSEFYREQKHLQPENRELNTGTRESDGLTDEQLEDTIKLLEEILKEIDR